MSRNLHWQPSCLLGLVACLCGSAIADEQFSLDVPGDPTLKSSAIVTPRGLTIVDPEGRRFTYTAVPELDSRDGAYLGYYSAEARQYLRWPASGQGAMFSGTGPAADLVWRQSKMRVQRLKAVGRDPVLRDPIGGRDPRGARDPLGPRDPVAADQRRTGPLHLAALPGRGGSLTVAQVDDAGGLHFYDGRDARWQHRDAPLRERLPAGAPLVLDEDPASEYPRVYAVSDRGEVVETRDGRDLTVISRRGDPRFNPGTHLARLSAGRRTSLAAIDERGQLIEIDPARGTFTPIEGRPGIFEPGIPLIGVSATEEELFLIDRRGNLLGYSLDAGRWSRPYRVAGGFPSGGELAGVYAPAAVGRAATILMAGVDATGRPHVFAETGGAWADDLLRDVRLPPGAPLGLTSGDLGLSVSAVGTDGRWTTWHRKSGAWVASYVADGFPAGAEVLLYPGLTGLAIDRTGRLIAGRYVSGVWECVICSPRFALAPRMVRRAIVPNEPLSPATVEFENRHKEELVMRIHNIALPERPIELSIPPGKSVKQRIERDAGATLEEVFLVAGPGGEVVEEVYRQELPPRRLYDVVVYANRVTSEYFDRTKGKKSAIPDEIGMSLVSLGVFPLPPGDLLADGARLDVYREAQAQRNPGAAALLDGNPGGK